MLFCYMAIDYIAIFGERHSGTKWLCKLVDGFDVSKNDRLGRTKYGHKHWFLPNDQPSGPESSTVFLVIVRDPYSWLSAMHRKPYHANDHFNLPMKEFLTREWISYESRGRFKKVNDITNEIITDRDPVTGNRFANVMQLRSAKLQYWKEFENRFSNFLMVKYEDLLFDFDVTITKICDVVGINPKSQLVPGPEEKKRKWTRDKEYMSSFDDECLKIIREGLDWELEGSLDYKKR